jgi:hypothetical protein
MAKPGLIVTENVAVAVFDAESVTLTTKLALPAIGVEPDTTPPLERLRPTAVRLLLPDVTVQVSPAPVPPEAARVCE